MIGSLGCSEYEAVLAWLSGELVLSVSNCSSGSAGGSVLSKVLMVSEVYQVAH